MRAGRGRAFAGLALVASVAPAADAPAPDPGVRNAHAMFYDGGARRVMLVAGADASSVRGDTWTWDGRRWERAAGTDLAPRTFPAATWDGARRQGVLFGGRRVLFGREGERGTFLADTWLRSGAGWQRVPVAGPTPRAEAAMAFDERRRVAVLFGGYNDEGRRVNRLDDTWEWDGRAWRRLEVRGPSPRNGATMVYDSGRRRVLLVGGGVGGPPSGETWEWDGSAWERVASGPGRFNSAGAFDVPRRTLVRFGGRDGRTAVADTWLFRRGSWSPLAGPGPAARNHSAAAFDAARKRTVLFGGHDGTQVFGDTWEFDGARWLLRADRPPEARVPNEH
jgi:hypothetical protein